MCQSLIHDIINNRFFYEIVAHPRHVGFAIHVHIFRGFQLSNFEVLFAVCLIVCACIAVLVIIILNLIIFFVIIIFVIIIIVIVLIFVEFPIT